MTSKKTVPISLRLSPELTRRLEEVAARTRQKKHALAQEAIEAAVDAIEKNDYRLVVPIEFSVTHVPKLNIPEALRVSSAKSKVSQERIADIDRRIAEAVKPPSPPRK